MPALQPTGSLRFSPEVVLSAAALILSLPLLLPLGAPVLDNDFLMYCTQHAIVREAILAHGTLPLETPAVGGGYPIVANPESPVLNPLVILSLAAGEAAGMKLIYLLCAAAAGVGGYWLCRYSLGLTAGGSLFAGACLLASAVMPGKFAGGNPQEAQLMLFPLGLHLLLQARKKRFFLSLVGLGWLLLMDAKFIAAIFWLYLFLAAAAWDSGRLWRNPAQRERGPPFLALATAALVVTLALGAVKILPVLDFFRLNGGLKPALLFNHALYYSGVKGLPPAEVLRGLADPRLIFWNGSADGAFTIGPVVLLFALASAAFARHSWRIGILALFSFWLACAGYVKPDLFRLLWERVPGFDLIDKPAKYFAPLAAAWLCVSAGIFVSRLSSKLSEGRGAALAILLLAAALPFPLALHHCAWREIIRIHPGAAGNPRRGGSFFHVASRRDPATPLEPGNSSIAYFNFKSGIGTIDAYLPISIPRRAVARYFILPGGGLAENPDYRGELEYPGGKPAAGEVAYRPNRIFIRLREPVRGPLVVNRNYDPGWESPDAAVTDRDGRISVAPRDTGAKEITLLYRPRSFRAGARISAAVLLGLAAWLAAGIARRARSR